MATTFRQSVEFPGVAPERLFDVYVSAGEHAAALGAPVEVAPVAGAPFSAFGPGKVRGRTLVVAPKHLVVQAWRAATWREDDPDSVLVLMFERTAAGGCIELFQAGVPEHALESLERGWARHYWEPWRRYLEARESRRPPRSAANVDGTRALEEER